MKKLIKKISFLFFISVFTTAVLLFSFNTSLKNKSFRDIVLKTISASLDAKLQADNIAISFDKKGLYLTGSHLQGSFSDNSILFNIPETIIKITYARVFQGSFFPDTIKAVSPQITYTSQPGNKPLDFQVNWSKKINSLLKKMAGRGTHIDISNGLVKYDSVILSHLAVKTIPDKAVTKLQLLTDVLYKKNKVTLQLSGSADNSLGRAFTYNFSVKAQSIPFDIIPKTRDFFFSKGTADFTGTLSGQRQTVNLDGRMSVHNMQMNVGWTSEDLREHQEKLYDIPGCSLDVRGNLKKRKIDFSFFDLQSDSFHIPGSLVLDFSSLTNPFLDLRFSADEMEVTTLKRLIPDPLINDWTTGIIFPRLENGTAEITRFILTGTVDEIGHLTEQENNHCMSWAGILKNVDTFYNDHIPLGRVHRAELAMRDDLLTINNISGKSGSSLLAMGNVLISKIYSPSSFLRADIEGSFSLPWLTTIFKSGVAGDELQMITSRVSSITGQADGAVGFTLELLSDDVKLKKLTGKGETSGPLDLVIDKLDLIHMKKTNFVLNYPGTSLVTGNGLWGNSTFKGKLNLIELDRKQTINLSLDASISDIKKIFSDNFFINSLAPCIISVPVSAKINVENGTIHAKGNMDFSKSKIDLKDNTCQEINTEKNYLSAIYDIKYSHNYLTFNDISLKSSSGKLTVTGRFLVNGNKEIIIRNLSVRAASFPLNSLSYFVPESKKFMAAGILDADVRSIKPVKDQLWSSFSGFFKLQGWHGFLKKLAVTVDNADIQGSFEKGLFYLAGHDVRIASLNTEYPITFKAELEKKELWNGTLSLYGNFLDITSKPGFFKQGKSDFKKDYPFTSLKIFAEIGHIRYRKLIFSPLLLKGEITKNRFFISNMLLEHANDFIWLTGTLTGKDVIYDSYFKFRQTPVNPFMAMLGFESKSITGSLDMEGKITAKVTPGSSIFETSKGPFSFEINNGSIVSSSSLIKILDLISLENIFDKQDVLKWKNSFNFNTIQGKFDLADGIFSTDSFTMDASAFDLFGQGKIDAMRKKIDMEVKVAPFGTIDKIIRSIPYLGFVLTGKSQSLFDYSLSVKGNLEDPEVHYVPLKNTFKSLTGYIKRLVTGREDVQKKINSQLKEDMERKSKFILLMKDKLAPLH